MSLSSYDLALTDSKAYGIYPVYFLKKYLVYSTILSFDTIKKEAIMITLKPY
jgi:hypothetical protein